MCMLNGAGAVAVRDFPLKDDTIARLNSGAPATCPLASPKPNPSSHDRRPDTRGSNTWKSHGRTHFIK